MIKHTGLSILFNSIRVTAERLAGHFFLKSIGPHISVMGSARICENDPLYAVGLQVGALIAENNYAVLTGGGPGLMQAANEGAYGINQKSFGISIKIPTEQKTNSFLRRNLLCTSFCSRKFLLLQYCDAIIFLPGGYGTLDELFEALTLAKTFHMHSKPFILVNKQFWQPMIDYLHTIADQYQTISENEMDLISIIDEQDLEHELAKLCSK